MSNGIDISSHQTGINVGATDAHFVIVKATQGTGYVNPDWKRQANQALKSGKKLGLYLYVNGSGAKQEADFFVNTVRDYIGKAILCVDWEKIQNSVWRNEAYLGAVVDRIYARTKRRAVIYSMQSAFPWNVCRRKHCATWVAQYANMNRTGWQAHPWNEGSYKCNIRQYSSCGRVRGWNGNLDLNKGYISSATWDKIAGAVKTAHKPASKPTTKPKRATTAQLAYRTLLGQYGNGKARKKNLGGRYNEVQKFINHIAYASTNTLVKETRAGKYGNGNMRKVLLGRRYNGVQKIINR